MGENKPIKNVWLTIIISLISFIIFSQITYFTHNLSWIIYDILPFIIIFLISTFLMLIGALVNRIENYSKFGHGVFLIGIFFCFFWILVLMREFSVFLFLILLAFFSFAYYSDRRNEKVQNHIKYALEINPTNSNEYQIFVPIGINPSKKIALIKNDFYSNLKVEKGSATFSIGNSKYGSALKIKANGPIIIQSIKKGGDDLDLLLSMDADKPDWNVYGYRKHWIFFKSSDCENLDIKISLRNDARFNEGGRSEITYPEFQTITKGWGQITTWIAVW